MNEWSPILVPFLGLFRAFVLSNPNVLIFVLSLLDFISLLSLRSLLVLEQETEKGGASGWEGGGKELGGLDGRATLIRICLCEEKKIFSIKEKKNNIALHSAKMK